MAPDQELEMLSQDQYGWADLPDNLVDDISRRLPVLSAITMGRVCKPWQRVLAERLPLSRRQGLPWLLLTFHNHHQERPCYSLLQRNFWSLRLPDALGKYCWGSAGDWLIIADPNPEAFTLDIHLCNPFSGSKLLLPTLHHPDCNHYGKMLLSASPDDPNCVFLLVANYDQSIACWSPAIPGSSWRLRDRRGIAFRDSLFCQGRFYFLTPDYNLHTLDAHDVISSMKLPPYDRDYHFYSRAIKLPLRSHQVVISEKPASPSRDPPRPYLVESAGEVLMVCRLFRCPETHTHPETHTFEVFNLDSGKMAWNKMQGLGDRVLFLGRSDSRSFSAKHLGPDLANRIFFFNDFPVNEWDKPVLAASTPPITRCTFMDWGSYDVDTKSFAPSGSNRGSLHSYPPIWITAPVWWFFTDSSTEKHQCINVAKRTGKSIGLLQQEEKKKKALKRIAQAQLKKKNTCRPEKRSRIAAIEHH